MKIGMLGTGVVGRTLGTKLVANGHEVMMGSRAKGNDRAVQWVEESGKNASEGTFADVAEHGEIVFNCTGGRVSLEALEMAGRGPLAEKILIDVANPLDFSKGMPPTLTICNTDSLGEQIQRNFPETKVVKALNTVNCEVMVRPDRVPGNHALFICGDDADAKNQVRDLLATDFGWPRERIFDLGDITAARGMEMYLLFWVRLMTAVGHSHFNVEIRVETK